MAPLYDNSAGYGHGGLGYDTSLDAMPRVERPSTVPSWAPWLGLAGAGLLGYAGIRGIGKLFRRAPKATPPRALHTVETEMLGRESPAIQKTIDTMTDSLTNRGFKLSSCIPVLGRIARGE